MTDWPELILNAAVRLLPAELREWGTAMQAELAHIKGMRQRWDLALGGARMALFPPRRGVSMSDFVKYWLKTAGIASAFSASFVAASLFMIYCENPATPPGEAFQIFLRGWLLLTLIFTPIVSGLRSAGVMLAKQWFTMGGMAVLFGLALIAPFAFMEYWSNPRIRSGEFRFPFLLFLVLWLPPALFFLTAMPIVRGLRTGSPILAHPIALTLRILFLVVLAVLWVNAIRNEMGCFLGGVPGCD
jgi:hypothetical protein